MEVAPKSFVNIFMFRVPVIGDAPVIYFIEDAYKFWKVVGREGHCLILRETVGKTSLQQRIDNFIKNESGFVYARALLTPHHIEPANASDIGIWAGNHKKEMESAL